MRRLLVLTALAAALTAGAQQRIVRLWNNASAPHDNGLRGGERVEEDRLFNTTEAVLYVYAADPARATGQAAVVCPGGGYRFLSIGGDGHAVGLLLAEHGVTAAVLKYRLPNGHSEVPRNDADEALRKTLAEAFEKKGYTVVATPEEAARLRTSAPTPRRWGSWGVRRAATWPLRPPRCSPKRCAPPSPC